MTRIMSYLVIRGIQGIQGIQGRTTGHLNSSIGLMHLTPVMSLAEFGPLVGKSATGADGALKGGSDRPALMRQQASSASPILEFLGFLGFYLSPSCANATARIKALALFMDSSSSRSGWESATIPPPA